MLRKLKSSCLTSKNITLDEQYPGMCRLIGQFSELYTYIREMYGPLKNCQAVGIVSIKRVAIYIANKYPKLR